jgi:hypothetical protein
MAKHAITIIIAAEGEDFRIEYRRNEGYSLYVAGEYCGSFDALSAAIAERDRVTYERLSRNPQPVGDALTVGDAVRIGASQRTGVVEGIGYTDVFVRLDDSGRLAAFHPQFVKRAA